MDLVNPSFLAILFSLPVAFAIDPFAPPLVLGLCLRFHLIHDPTLLSAAFAGFATWPFLAVIVILVVGLPLLWLSWTLIKRATQGAKHLFQTVSAMDPGD